MQQYLEAGKVVTTHGVRGEMKLELWCDGVNFLKKVGRLYASAQGGRAYKIVSIRAQGQMALLQLEGVDDMDAARALRGQGWELLQVMSFAAGQDTRFGRASGWRHQLEGLTGRPVLDTLQAVEPLGPRQLADALVIAPCTGATLARLAEGLSDTPVTLAAKSLLRVGCPVVIAVSTNDGLGASGENIARLYQRKHYYFVPYGQDDPNTKPQSLKARFELLPQTLEAALEGRQLQPVLQCPCG